MKNIDKEKYYSVNQIFQEELIPWFNSHVAITNFVESKDGSAILKPIIKQSKKRKAFLIKGEKIIELIKKAEEGKLKFNWKSIYEIRQ